jgi:DNA-binding SARP family transcriptional activator
VEIRVIGPLEVRRDGRVVDAPELRRGRVRELLSVLAVERTISRDRAIELLWPDHEPAKGRANLRVTLAHLQRLLEPERSTGEPTYFVQASPTRLSLPAVPGLAVDLWAVEEALAESDRARLRGDAPARVRHLRDAVDRWRGRPLTDLERLPDLEPAGSHLALRLLDATLTLGELELVGGDVGRATRCAELSIAADPYDERAHRLAVAAGLHAGDRSGTAIAIARLHQALDELGVGPAEPTQMLLRQADPWLGVRLVAAGAGLVAAPA